MTNLSILLGEIKNKRYFDVFNSFFKTYHSLKLFKDTQSKQFKNSTVAERHLEKLKNIFFKGQ